MQVVAVGVGDAGVVVVGAVGSGEVRRWLVVMAAATEQTQQQPGDEACEAVAVVGR